MKKIALFIALLITISINADNLLHFSGSEASIIGIYIEDLRTGKIVASQNENKAMTPASVTKSITSAAAMLLLEKDFQFSIEYQILSIADKYTALREERCYKNPFGKYEALEIIAKEVNKGLISQEVFTALIRIV